MNDKQEFFITGAKRDKKDKRDYKLAGIMAPGAIPKQLFIIEDVFDSKNQGSRGSCTSQAQAHHKERQEKKKLSARFVMALSKQLEGDTDYGGYARNSFKVAYQNGICSEEVYPEPGNEMTWEEYIDVAKIPQAAFDDAAQHKSQSFWWVNTTVDDIRNCLITYKNSVNMSMPWYSEFNRPLPDGTLPSYSGTTVGGHEIDIKGFDDYEEKLICKNSWGESWGNKGDFKIPYSMFPALVWDLWCSLDIPAEMPVDLYYGEKRTWANYMLEKSFAFSPWIYKKIGRLPTNREVKGLTYGKWSADAVFSGKVKDVWLKIIKPEAIKNGVIDINENLIK